MINLALVEKMRKTAYNLLIVSTMAGLFPIAASAENRVSGPIAVEVVSVHDGDSFTAVANMWPEQFVRTKVRVAGIDAPEINSRCDRERRLAREARELTEKFLKSGAPIVIQNVRLDKYAGRVDADVIDSRGASLAAALLKARLAYAYDGGTKRGWCN